MEEIFRALIANDCGIELNTSGGQYLLPDRKWLILYRKCGGRIITLGSDAHRTEHVGRGIKEQQELLRMCGFQQFATFKDRQPVFHAL